jgi:hypothetical protein
MGGVVTCFFLYLRLPPLFLKIEFAVSPARGNDDGATMKVLLSLSAHRQGLKLYGITD